MMNCVDGQQGIRMKKRGAPRYKKRENSFFGNSYTRNFCFIFCALVLTCLLWNSCARVNYTTSDYGTIQNIHYSNGQLFITFSNGTKVSWDEGRVGNRFFIDLKNIRARTTGKRAVGDAFIQSYHWAQNTSRIVRVVLTLQTGKTVRVTRSGDGVVMIVSGARPWEQGKRKFKILVDPGHGGKDSGAKGKGGTLEKDINLDIAKRLVKSFSRHHYIDVRLTRDKDVTLSLDERRNISRKFRPDLFISIHMNASEKPSKNQAEVYYYYKSSRVIASRMAEALEEALGAQKRVVRQGDLHVLKNNGATLGVLVEPIHLSNYAVEKHLKKMWFRNQIVSTVYSTIIKYIRTR